MHAYLCVCVLERERERGGRVFLGGVGGLGLGLGLGLDWAGRRSYPSQGLWNLDLQKASAPFPDKSLSEWTRLY
ncbi:unnamed protein product [Coffea canephora]|uniref:Uncharacterized protein n=1 Tax=Coffea canephora TaxID=49390 RepID=A0A068UZC4_COFCA|nr:unnamed protein product [Coffea canephora]